MQNNETLIPSNNSVRSTRPLSPHHPPNRRRGGSDSQPNHRTPAMTTKTEYRGNDITGYTILKAKCFYCDKLSVIRVVRDNSNPPQGYIRGGTIVTEYCQEHTPKEILADIESWKTTLQTPLGR